MRLAFVVGTSLACLLTSAEGRGVIGPYPAPTENKYFPWGQCKLHDCVLPVGGIAFGAGSSAYLSAWFYKAGDVGVAAHVAGLLVGGVSTITGVAYATTNDPAPKYRAFGAVGSFVVGVPSLVLGLRGLVTAGSDKAEVKPGPAPNWYGPSYAIDARGRMTPSFVVGGVF